MIYDVHKAGQFQVKRKKQSNAATHCGQSGKLPRRGGLPVGRGGGSSLGVVGRRRDLMSVAAAGYQRDPLVSRAGAGAGAGSLAAKLSWCRGPPVGPCECR